MGGQVRVSFCDDGRSLGDEPRRRHNCRLYPRQSSLQQPTICTFSASQSI